MHAWKLFLCLGVCAFGVGVQAGPKPLRDDLAVGYYWRQYTRDIPHDALPGGMDRRGKTTYIGQTAHKACDSEIRVAGQIREAEQTMMYEWGYKKKIADGNVQVLCTQRPEHFRWIKTTPYDIKTFKNVHLVSGGIEKDYQVYIGRVFVDGEVAIGKVLVSNSPDYLGLYTVLNNTYLHEKKAYEVLAYDPNLPKKEGPKTMRLKSPNSSTINVLWQPLLVIIGFMTLGSTFR